MEKILQAATIAWNPIGEVRRRMEAQSLTVSSVLVPFVGIVIASNLFAFEGQRFFSESVLYLTGGELPKHPLLSDFALRLISALGVLMPAAAVSLLPSGIFHPPGRSATVSAMLAVAASQAFYGAAVGVLVYFVARVLATVNLELGLITFTLLSIPMGIGLIGLVLFFWFRITVSVLNLSAARVIGISIVAIITYSIMAGCLLLVGLATPV